MPLEIREATEGETLVLELVGRLDTKTSGALEKAVATHLAAGQRRFVLDLTNMEYVSSAGLRIFLMLAKKVSGGTGGLALCGLSPQVKEVFDIAGFTRLFTLAATRAEALAGGGKGPAAKPAKTPAKAGASPVAPAAPAPAPAAPAAPAAAPANPLVERAAKALKIPSTAERAATPEVRALAVRAASALAQKAPADGGKSPR